MTSFKNSQGDRCIALNLEGTATSCSPSSELFAQGPINLTLTTLANSVNPRAWAQATLFGFVRSDVSCLRANFSNCHDRIVPITKTGAFVLRLSSDQLTRGEQPTELVALDNSGTQLGSTDVPGIAPPNSTDTQTPPRSCG